MFERLFKESFIVPVLQNLHYFYKKINFRKCDYSKNSKMIKLIQEAANSQDSRKNSICSYFNLSIPQSDCTSICSKQRQPASTLDRLPLDHPSLERLWSQKGHKKAPQSHRLSQTVYSQMVQTRPSTVDDLPLKQLWSQNKFNV